MGIVSSDLVALYQEYILTDDLLKMDKGRSAIRGDDAARSALRSFLGGRHRIETSWDYRTTLKSFESAADMVKTYSPAPGETGVVAWFESVVNGHSFLQSAEASWTLCNFSDSIDLYLKASDEFFLGPVKLEGQLIKQGTGLDDYSKGWGELANGMHHNVKAESLVRRGNMKDAQTEFTEARNHLFRAQDCFSKINNRLGLRDARSYIVSSEAWKGQELLRFTALRMNWKDYSFFKENQTTEAIFRKLDSVNAYPSELVLKEHGEELSLMTAQLGQLGLSKIGDSKLPPISVQITLHPEHVLEIEYAIIPREPVDPFFLYLLRILNTDAVPTYDIEFSSPIQGLSFKQDNVRLKDVTKEILNRLGRNSGGSTELQTLESFVAVMLYDYAPREKVSMLGRGRFRYLESIFSESETLTLTPSEEEVKTPENLFGEIGEDAAAYVNERAAIVIVPGMQEWEAEMYYETLDYVLESKQTTFRLIREMTHEADLLAAKLEALRGAVKTKEGMSQREVRNLISSNLDVRLRALKLIGVQQRRDILNQTNIKDVRIFARGAERKLGVTETFDRANALSERIETLYNTAYNLGQDYLSLVIAINSDVSAKAFNVLNLVMMGSLGLAFVTAILSTPVSYTFAILGVFLTSFFGYLYLSYIRRKATRFHR